MTARKYHKKILLVQGIIPPYRIPLFNILDGTRGRLTVAHSGTPTSGQGAMYEEVLLPAWHAGPFRWQSHLMALRSQYDAIVAMFDVRWLSSDLMLYRKARQQKFIWWGIGIGNHRIARYARSLLAQSADAVILYSEEAVGPFCSLGVPRSKIFVAPNTVEVEPQWYQSSSPERRNSLLFVGTVNRRKELDSLLRCFSRARLPGDIKLRIVGDGPEKFRLQGLTAELGLQERVDFFPGCNANEDLAQHYQHALASVSVGQAGLSILQSFGFGVPFITRRNAISGGELFNVKHQLTGLLCDHHDASLIEALQYICSHRDICLRLGRSAFDHYQRSRTMSCMVTGFIEALDFAFLQ